MDLFFTNIAYASVDSSVDSFIAKVDTLIINPVILLLFALALVYFLYGVFEFISHQESEQEKTKGKSHMLWGIVGITIMMGVWVILRIVLNTLDIKQTEINPEKGIVNLNDINVKEPPKLKTQ